MVAKNAQHAPIQELTEKLRTKSVHIARMEDNEIWPPTDPLFGFGTEPGMVVVYDMPFPDDPLSTQDGSQEPYDRQQLPHLDDPGGREATGRPPENPPPAGPPQPKPPDPWGALTGKCRKNCPWEKYPRYQAINLLSMRYRKKRLNADDTIALFRAFRTATGFHYGITRKNGERTMKPFWDLVAAWNESIFRLFWKYAMCWFQADAAGKRPNLRGTTKKNVE